MKARIPPDKRMTLAAKSAVDQYIYEKTHDELMRFLKIVNVVLNRHFGFGKTRLNRFNAELNSEMSKHKGDPALWVTIDRILIDEIGLPFKREDYESRENAMQSTRHMK